MKLQISICAFLLVVALPRLTIAIDFDGALKEARVLSASQIGRAYERKVSPNLNERFATALRTCSATARAEIEPIDYVLIVGADGTVTDVLFNGQNPVANCVLMKGQLPKRLAPPPHAPWILAVRVGGP